MGTQLNSIFCRSNRVTHHYRRNGIKADMDSIKRAALKYWAKDMINLPYHVAFSIGFRSDDARVLEEVGLPSWAAPNVHMDIPSAADNGEIVIGEDRDDQNWCYDITSGKIFVGPREGNRELVAMTLSSLLKILIAYAEMVDEAIRTNSRAFVDNAIPAELINKFEVQLKAELPQGTESTWVHELERLRQR